MNEPVSNETENIWITAKTRIYSEKRYKRYSFWSHLLFSYYAFLMIVTSIFAESLSERIEFFSQINIAIAVALFAGSLIVYGFKFDSLAAKHRDCYLRLNRLLSEHLDSEVLLDKYHEILGGYPNHSSADYEDMVIVKTVWHGGKLWNSKGESIEATRGMITRFVINRCIYYAFLIVAFVLPAYFLAAPFF